MSNYINREELIQKIREMPCEVISEYNLDWKNLFQDLVRCLGSATYGKERWFLEYHEKGGRARWYDRDSQDYISTDEVIGRIYEEVKRLSEE